MVPELKEIPKRYGELQIDLMLVHLGGTTIPGRSLPLLMVCPNPLLLTVVLSRLLAVVTDRVLRRSRWTQSKASS